MKVKRVLNGAAGILAAGLLLAGMAASAAAQGRTVLEAAKNQDVIRVRELLTQGADAKLAQAAPPSREASVASRLARVGLPLREYSYPLCLPGEVWV